MMVLNGLEWFRMVQKEFIMAWNAFELFRMPYNSLEWFKNDLNGS